MKQKIAFCIPNMIIGGVETVFLTTLNELLKNPDIEIVVVTHAVIREPVYVKWFAEHPEIKVYVYRPLSNWFEDMAPRCRGPLKPLRKIAFSLYKKYRRVFMWATRRLADVDIFIDYKNLEFSSELKYFNKPKIAWLHSAMSYFERNNTFSKLSQYDKVIGLTDDFVDEFKQKQPLYANKILRIYNALNIPEIRAKAKSERAPAGKYFCHVSRLVAGKDIKTLLDAFEIFYKKHPDFGLYIVGDGDKAMEFKSYADKLKSRKNIFFTGALDNPYSLMRGAVANILSSQFEGLPTVCIESQILRTLMISSNCKNGPREILDNGNAGLLFEIGDVKKLAQCMEFAITKKTAVNRMIKNATSGLKRFDTSTITEQILNVTTSVLEKRRVAFLVPPMTIGGVETVLGQTLTALLKRQDISIAVYFHVPLTEPFWIKWFAEHPEIETHICLPHSAGFERLRTHIPVVENIRKLVFGLYKKYRHIRLRTELNKFDIVIDFVTCSSFKFLRGVTVPKFTWIHCSYDYFIEKRLQTRLFLYDKVICITDRCLKSIAQAYPEYSDKLVKIYNPCDYKNVAAKAKNSKPKIKAPYFCCVSRLDTDKDISTIIRAFDSFWHKAYKPNCTLVIVGDGNTADELRQLATSLDSSKKIVFTGKIPEPYGYMHNSLAHILSSKREGLGMVMIEAMASGTLNIASDCPDGPSDVLLKGRAGLLFDVGNIQQLAKIMSDVWANKVNTDKIKSAAYKSLVRFDADKIAKQIINIINKMEIAYEKKA